MQKEGIPLETAVKGITSNVASVLKLGAKGQLKPGFDADICLLSEDTLELKTVMAKGSSWSGTERSRYLAPLRGRKGGGSRTKMSQCGCPLPFFPKTIYRINN